MGSVKSINRVRLMNSNYFKLSNKAQPILKFPHNTTLKEVSLSFLIWLIGIRIMVMPLMWGMPLILVFRRQTEASLSEFEDILLCIENPRPTRATS